MLYLKVCFERKQILMNISLQNNDPELAFLSDTKVCWYYIYCTMSGSRFLLDT